MTIPALKSYTPLVATADEKPSKLVLHLKQQHKQRQEQATTEQRASFYYMYGMGYATANDSTVDIINKGKQIVQQISAIENMTTVTAQEKDQLISTRYQNIVTKLGFIEVPKTVESEVLCKSNKACIDTMFAHKKSWQKTIATHHLHHKVYQRFLAQQPSVYGFKNSSPQYPLPNYGLLIKGQKVHRLSLFTLADTGHADKAYSNALQELHALRHHVAHADTLISKMIMKSLITEHLQTIALLQTRFGVSDRIHVHIEPLSATEMSLWLPLLSEMLTSERMFSTMQQYFAFKPIETSNIRAKMFEMIRAQNKKLPSHLAEDAINNRHINIGKDIFSADNIFGWQLIRMSSVDYAKYGVDMHLINNSINAVNHIYRDKPLRNTFAPTLRAVTKTDDALCYARPETRSKLTTACVLL